mmetsp:Transcript_41924/g.116755  ORF Transcript_41924/g.116755 Transcript_41924/m.116755 type:complete len:257 (-) Transcript_41924:107-877(-)
MKNSPACGKTLPMSAPSAMHFLPVWRHCWVCMGGPIGDKHGARGLSGQLLSAIPMCSGRTQQLKPTVCCLHVPRLHRSQTRRSGAAAWADPSPRAPAAPPRWYQRRRCRAPRTPPPLRRKHHRWRARRRQLAATPCSRMLGPSLPSWSVNSREPVLAAHPRCRRCSRWRRRRRRRCSATPRRSQTRGPSSQSSSATLRVAAGAAGLPRCRRHHGKRDPRSLRATPRTSCHSTGGSAWNSRRRCRSGTLRWSNYGEH